MRMAEWQRLDIRYQGWLAVVKVVTMFLTTAALLLAIGYFFPRDLLPYKCTTIHKLHTEKLDI